MRTLVLYVLTAAAALGASAASAQQPAPAPKSCFFINQFRTWKAPDDKTMFIRVGTNRYYRLDMAGSCSALKGINPHLITTFSGSNSVCSKLDWNLKVARAPGSPPEGCIVKEMTELTPEQVKAIPKKFKP